MVGQNWDTQADWDAATKDGIQVDGSTFTLASAIPDSGVARYNFEQNLTDAWNANDLTGSGGVTFQSGGQQGDYYAVLDGSDDYETAPFQFNSSDDFSFVGWVYFESYSGSYQPIVAQRDASDTMDWALWLDTTGSLSDGWAFGFGESLAALYNNNNGVNMPDTATGTWAHLGFTKGGDTWTFYLDDAQKAQVTDSTSWTTSDTLHLGAWQSGGSVSNIRQDLWEFHSKELSSAEISNHYSTGSISG